MNINQKINIVLHKAYPVLKSLHDDFFVIGSAALILSGVDIENTNDIDILTSDRDADSIREGWKDREIVNYQTGRSNLFRSNFARYHFEELDVEVMGALEIHKNDVWSPLIIREAAIISLQDIRIKIPVLEEQRQILQWFGRDKDIEKIKRIDAYFERNKR